MPLFTALKHNAVNMPVNEHITELSIKGSLSQELLLFPIISHLTSMDTTRWVTWINPPRLDRNKLKEFGLDQRPILIINTRSQNETNKLLLRCLNNGKSNTVIANISNSQTLDHHQINFAAGKGNSRCLLIH